MALAPRRDTAQYADVDQILDELAARGYDKVRIYALHDVGDPKLLRGVGSEHTFHLVLEDGGQATGSTVSPLTMVDSLQLSQPHQPLDPAVTSPQAPAKDESGVDAAKTEGSPCGSMQGADPFDQVRIGDIPVR